MGLRTFTPVGELLCYDSSPVHGSPNWRVWDLSLLLSSYCLIVASFLLLDTGYHFGSVGSAGQLCPNLCTPMDYNMPGFHVHHQLLELTQTHVH